MIGKFKVKVQKPGYTEEGEEKEKLNLLKKVLHSVVHIRVSPSIKNRLYSKHAAPDEQSCLPFPGIMFQWEYNRLPLYSRTYSRQWKSAHVRAAENL
jgi:hypothetical protein